MSLKKFISALLVTLCVAAMGSTVMAAPIETGVSEDVTVQSTVEIVPYADVIEPIYRVLNGVSQYRRWNYTKNCWVDPYWINL